jgi:FixJ family two-component response regulator
MTDNPRSFMIAVVDDDPRILESLKNLLESADHAVRLFASGRAVLESDCLEEIDCLISDIDMPVMGGFELLRLVHDARPALPVILITGHSDMLSRLPPVEWSNCRLLKKPFDGHKMLAAVSDALRNPAPRAPRSER